MKRNRILSMQVHFVADENPVPVQARFNAFRAEVIARGLNGAGFSKQQKIEILNKIISQI